MSRLAQSSLPLAQRSSLLAQSTELGGAASATEGRADTGEPDAVGGQDIPTNLDEALDTVRTSLGEMWNDFLLRLPLMAAAVVVLLLTWGFARLGGYFVRRSLGRARLRRSLKDLIRQVVCLVIWVVGLLAAAVVVFPGMTPAKILTVLGLGSIAIGFAFKDIVENFFAGVLILWRFPFEPGDFIECGDIRGEVEQTTIRMTTIRQVDGQLVVLPNAHLFKLPVTVVTSRPKRRTTIICGVDYDTDLDKARTTLQQALRDCRTVDQEKSIDIFAQEFSGSSINFEVTWWTGASPYEVRQSRDEVVRAVKSSLDAAEISIPFPHRTLLFKGTDPEELELSRLIQATASGNEQPAADGP